MKSSVLKFICVAAVWSAIWHGFAAEQDPHRKWLDWITFCIENEDKIVGESFLTNVAPEGIRGLRLTDKSAEKCVELGATFSNVISLHIKSEKQDSLETMMLAATNFPKLEYLHFEARLSRHIPSADILTNLIELHYLGFDAPLATNIDSSIYSFTPLKEIMLRVGGANLPNGISRLTNLTKMEVYGKRTVLTGRLPTDFTNSTLEDFEAMNVSDVDEWLPILPTNLQKLSLPGCRFATIPSAWLKDAKLEVLDLDNTSLTRFPSELLDLPSLKVLDLHLNQINNVPAINLPKGSKLRIDLQDNPIKSMAPENKVLIKRGNIAK